MILNGTTYTKNCLSILPEVENTHNDDKIFWMYEGPLYGWYGRIKIEALDYRSPRIQNPDKLLAKATSDSFTGRGWFCKLHKH